MIAVYRMLTHPIGDALADRAGKWVCMLAFGTLFSCQGAQSSHY